MAGDARKVVILGSGPAGLTAAIYAARADLSPLVIEGVQPGGQLMITTDVENYPGFAEGIMGPELMEVMKKQAARFGTNFVQATVDGVEFGDGLQTLRAGDDEFRSNALIISTGASARWLDVKGEKEFQGRGVSACATCDGFFFRDQVIVVVGGGDTAMEEATFLTKFASKVYVIHRRDELRASKAMQERAVKNEKIDFIWDTVVEEVVGSEKVTGVRLKNVKTGEESSLDCGGFFVAIGHTPNTGIFAGKLEMDESGYLVTEPDSTRTSIDGVYAAGDVTDHVYRQAVTAAGMGCMAALDAERWLTEKGIV
jgi:thioredoxin reductase (NADPH)